jgi:hypothetical protein
VHTSLSQSGGPRANTSQGTSRAKQLQPIKSTPATHCRNHHHYAHDRCQTRLSAKSQQFCCGRGSYDHTALDRCKRSAHHTRESPSNTHSDQLALATRRIVGAADCTPLYPTHDLGSNREHLRRAIPGQRHITRLCSRCTRDKPHLTRCAEAQPVSVYRMVPELPVARPYSLCRVRVVSTM